MGVQMNIKNAEAYAIAAELAELGGISMTQVVLEALRKQQRELGREAKIAKVMALCRDTASRMSPELRAIDHGELLYDERGLPK
jgi:antitoxin VapB